MRKSALRGCLIFLVVFVSPIAIGENKLQHPNQAPKIESKEQPNNRLEPHQNATAVDNPPAPTDKTESASKSNKYVTNPEFNQTTENGTEFWPPIYGYRVKVTDSLLVLFTFLLWLATRKLVIGAEAASNKQLRAYISVTPFQMSKVDPNDNVVIRYLIINHGETPAYSAVHSAEIAFVDYPLPTDFAFPKVTDQYRSKSAFNKGAPGIGTAISSNRFTQAQWTEIFQAPASGGRRLYIFGKVIYYDIFGKKHWTKFCFSFQGHHEMIPLAQSGNWIEINKKIGQSNCAFEASDQHNTTDDQ